ncbi:MAG: LynF/TruF/PatF family peptide O-prenyltransferase [Oscillatoria sp. SIO1A7]|nr:LynF/TruF/PatF family peptide O-prenyltransferase [Oscillatoria sp. SIO1A7]
MTESNIDYANIVTHDREKRLRYFNEHKRAFNVENLYVLDKFEFFLQKIEEPSLLESGFKIDLDRLHAGRFCLGYLPQNKERQFTEASNFLRYIESRVEVKLNYSIIYRFLEGFDANKAIKLLVGVDARYELADSKIKLYILLEKYPEKFEQAISLCGDSSDVRSLICETKNLLVGFDFYLDGRTDIEIYPMLVEEDWLRAEVREKLEKMLPYQALKLLKACHALQIGFSKANDSKVIYFHPIDNKGFAESLDNEMAKKVNAYYRNQPVIDLLVAIPELELRKRSIQRLNLYYTIA